MKQQIWLRTDQVELLNACLLVVKASLASQAKITGNSAVIMGCNFTEEQINKVLKLTVKEP